MKYLLEIILLGLFVICFFVLWYLNNKKLYTSADIPIQNMKLDIGNIITPVIYHLVYKSSSGSTWSFDPSKQFIDDFKNKRINTLLIGGSMYDLKKAEVENNMMILLLDSNCGNDALSSFVGSKCDQNAWPSNTLLMVLGYKFI